MSSPKYGHHVEDVSILLSEDRINLLKEQIEELI